MKRIMLCSILSILFLLNQNIYAQNSDTIRYSKITHNSEAIQKIIEIGKRDNRAMHHLDVICNRFGGRLLGSDAYTHAANWCADQFRKWGMEVIMQEAGELPVGFNRGPWFGRMLSEDGFILHFATPSYTSGTKGVQRGHVVFEPKTKAQFNRMKGKLKGAWVLVTGESEGWPINPSEYGDAVRAMIIAHNIDTDRYNDSVKKINQKYPNRTPIALMEKRDAPALFYKEMVEAGILGIIQSSKVPIRALYDRSNVEYFNFDSLPKIPDIKLNEHQYNIIAQKVKERQYFQLEFDIRNHFYPGPVKYHNVIGIIRGSEYPDEYVIAGGHLDAFDVATGGVDDGSGITPHMEAARLIMESGAKPKRSIVIALWAGEEFGLWGSKFWVEQNMDKLGKISNYFNRDGGPTVASSLTVPPAMYDDFLKVCEPLSKINPDFPFTLKVREGEIPERPTNAGGSDHAHFAINGVPTISFGTGDPKGYDFSYYEIWHTERDTYNMSIPEYQEHTAIVTAVVLVGIADLDHLLSREGLYKKDKR